MFSHNQKGRLSQLADRLNICQEPSERHGIWREIEGVLRDNAEEQENCIIVCYSDIEDGFSPPYYWLAEIKYMTENDKNKLFEPDYGVYAFSKKYDGIIMLNRKQILKKLGREKDA